ncbi:MAG: peptide/nickel transport system ATP-binding protein [Desulfovibrionales bacterium]|nr:peptide/nickel transport system ATP-binding protein [Desulfovibrionales bacterium]
MYVEKPQHNENDTLLCVRNLKTHIRSDAGEIRVVDGVDLQMKRGETVGIVGESGCGKSMTGLSILRLVPGPHGRIVSGEILFNGQDLASLDEKEMVRLRGNEIAMVFQDPMTSLDPLFAVGDQIGESMRFHQKLSRKEARNRAIELLKLVGVPSPELRIKDRPDQLSGGLRQRVMLASALSCKPSLVIADEPTTALDVTIQAQILELIKQLREETGTSFILISHDLGVIAENCQHVSVMYAGKIVESADVRELFDNPLHPYTTGLMESIPRIGVRKDRLEAIPGIVPNPLDLGEGCAFSPRCSCSEEHCEQKAPPLVEVCPGHEVRCWKYCNHL